MQLSSVGAQNIPSYAPRRQASEAQTTGVSDGFTPSNGAALPDLKSLSVRARQEAPPAQPLPTKVDPDSGGKIEHLVFQLDGAVPPNIRNEVFTAWTTVFKNIDPDVKVTITVESQKDKSAVEKLVADNEIPNPERFNLLVADDLNITMWARDQMVGLQDAEKGVLLGQTTMRPHGDDELLPPRIAASVPGLGFDPDKRLQTDGGDEVSNTKESFVGYTSVYLTAQKLFNAAQGVEGKAAFTPFSKELKMSMPNAQSQVPDFKFEPNIFKSTSTDLPNEGYWLNQATQLFEQKYGKPVTILGQDDPATPEIERPATFHVDMGFTCIDDHKALVGNPQQAIDILRGLSPEQYAEHNKLLNQQLGRPESMDTLGELIQHNTTGTPDLQHQFDYNAENVEAKGYEVQRMPYLEGPRGVSWITYNNCLMENYQREDGSQVRRVFLPTYGLPALDDAASKIYQENGYEVIPLKLTALTSWRGAIRCISNVLDRGEAGPPQQSA